MIQFHLIKLDLIKFNSIVGEEAKWPIGENWVYWLYFSLLNNKKYTKGH